MQSFVVVIIHRIPVMWKLVILAHVILVAYAQQQNSRRPEPHDNGHGWDIRLAVPGEPGGDYPTLNTIPRTSFSCSRKSPGYYADVETGCQVFRVCTLGSTYGFQSFLCPNGTLFNQEVLVCDWWMNVNCDKSQQLFNEHKEKFGNLKLGPQLMKDIKKMLTHPMRNPYNKSIMTSNLIVMQEYKPPSGQLFPIGALISGPERPPSNVYVPSKLNKGNLIQNSFVSEDLSFAASTPSSQYIPSSFNTLETSKYVDIRQQERQSIQNSNSHAGLTRPNNPEFINNNRISQSSNTQTYNQRNLQSQNLQNGLQSHLPQDNSNINSLNHIRHPGQKEVPISTQFSYNSKQNAQLIHENNTPQQFKDVNGHIVRDTHQNLGSNNIGQPVGKTLKFSRIVQKSTSGNPKSRVTFKTWIVRPSKAARLLADPTPYSYDKPPNPSTENIVAVTEVYNNPTTETLIPESENVPYVYNRPTPSSKQIIVVDETPVIYLPPTVPTLTGELYSTSGTPQPTKPSHLDLPPTTYKPASRFYIPPSESSNELSRQYLNPNKLTPQEINYQSARLIAAPTSPSLDFSTTVTKNNKTPSFSLTKQSHINTNHNNLSFSDILTKEKLDITVNDIVKNTNEILKTASADELNQYRQNQIDNNLANNYFSEEVGNKFDENRTFQSPQIVHESEKLIATPSTELEPPIATSSSDYQNQNKLLNLSFFKELVLPTNTIERTVSVKITLPEKIAELLFKNHTQSNYHNLENLNTESSNYLVLSNSNLDENNDSGLIPIGKFIWDRNINVSNSQALVYSFLADSINAAKEYSNIAKQNLVSSPPTQLQIRNINNEDISDISDRVSRLTASHFAKDNPNSGNFVHLSPNSRSRQFLDNSKSVTEVSQQSTFNRHANSQFFKNLPPTPLHSSRLQRLSNNNHIENLQKNTEQIYSGQLYKLSVPEVTSKIYNSPNLRQESQTKQTSEHSKNSQRDVRINNNSIKKLPITDVEVFPTESALYPPVTQQLPHAGPSKMQFHNTRERYENIFGNTYLNTDTAITAQVQDKISGSLPHPLQENKLITYQKDKSYFLYTKLDDDNNDKTQDINAITNERTNQQKEKLIRSNDIANRVTFELLPVIGYDLEGEQEKNQVFKGFKIEELSNSANTGRSESFRQDQDNLVAGVDFTILHPSSKKYVEQRNNRNAILYRGPSSYFAPQSSVGSLGGAQQTKSFARIEKFDDTNGYSKTIPARQFLF